MNSVNSEISSVQNKFEKSKFDYRTYRSIVLRNGANGLLIRDAKTKKCAVGISFAVGKIKKFTHCYISFLRKKIILESTNSLKLFM